MANSLLVRALKRIGNEIISVSLKALIVMTAVAIAGAATVVWLALRGNPHSPWFYAMAGALCSALLNILILAGLVSLRIWRGKSVVPIAEVNGIDPKTHEQVVSKLGECESMVRHWQAEVGRMKTQSDEQIRIRDGQVNERGGKIGNLEQQLRVVQDKLDEFKSPRLRLKIKHAEYHMLGKVGLDVTDVLDQMVLDERLVLSVPYDEIFRPDPQPHVHKHLTINFSHGIKEFSVTVPQNARLTLPFPYQLEGAT